MRRASWVGFAVPTARFRGSGAEWLGPRPAGLLNVYTPPMMRRTLTMALAWLRGDAEVRAQVESEGLMDVAGGVLDELLTTTFPVPRSRAVERRRHVLALSARAFSAPWIVLTLGLIEVWTHRDTGAPLARSPCDALRVASGDAYQYRRLRVSEVQDDLAYVLQLLRDHGHPGLVVWLTVSPVPLVRTFEREDVLVANQHSKAVLRAAAGEVAPAFPFVSYIPTYESVILSQSPAVWEDDLRHVAPDVVAALIERVVKGHVDVSGDPTMGFRLDWLSWIAHVGRCVPADWPLSPDIRSQAQEHAAAAQSLPMSEEAGRLAALTRGCVEVLSGGPVSAAFLEAVGSTDDPMTLTAMVVVLAGCGHADAAVAHATRVLELRPHEPTLLAWLPSLLRSSRRIGPRIVWLEGERDRRWGTLSQRGSSVRATAMQRVQAATEDPRAANLFVAVADLIRLFPDAAEPLRSRAWGDREKMVYEAMRVAQKQNGDLRFDSRLADIHRQLALLEFEVWRAGARRDAARIGALVARSGWWPEGRAEWVKVADAFIASGATTLAQVVLGALLGP